MSLIQCSECNKKISDQAISCPNCGNPINSDSDNFIGKVETERTNKKWKKTGCFALIIGFIGFMMLPTKSMPLGVVLIIIALGISFYARIGAWWNNG